MPIDERIRSGLLVNAEQVHTPVERNLDSVRRRHRRATYLRRLTAGAVAAALVVAGAAAVRGRGGDVSPAPTPPTITPSPTPGTDSAEPADLEGSWRTPQLNRNQVTERLTAAGVAPGAAARFTQGLPSGTFRVRMTVYQSQLQARIGSQPLRFRVGLLFDGDVVTLAPLGGSPGTWSLGWSLDDDVLTFELRGTDVRDYDGIPARVHALGVFCVAPFRPAS